MNTFGAATQGKNTEKKTVAETFLAGHVLLLSLKCRWPTLQALRAILDGLEYRGTMFLQAFTTCQPEHGVATTWLCSRRSAYAIHAACLSSSSTAPRRNLPGSIGHQGQPVHRSRLVRTKSKTSGEIQRYTVAHGAPPKPLPHHLKKIKPERLQAHSHRQHAGAHHAAGCRLSPLLTRVTRLHSDFGVYITWEENARSIIVHSRVNSSCSAWSAARPGACCSPRRAS